MLALNGSIQKIKALMYFHPTLWHKDYFEALKTWEADEEKRKHTNTQKKTHKLTGVNS